MSDWLAKAIGPFSAQAQVIVTTIAGSPTNYGTTPTVMTAVAAERVAFEDAEALVQVSKASLAAAVDARDAARATLEASLRDLNRGAQALPASPDALAAAGLPVHDTTRTPGTAPTERPDVRAQVVGQEHRLTIVDQSTLRPARPAAARMTELYRAVVPAGQPVPTGIDGMQLVGTYTASRVTLQYPSADIGKSVVYLARYVGARNQLGPAGTTTVASVAA